MREAPGGADRLLVDPSRVHAVAGHAQNCAEAHVTTSDASVLTTQARETYRYLSGLHDVCCVHGECEGEVPQTVRLVQPFLHSGEA